jgi:hypothetical protein
MYEYIFTTIIRGDKTETFGIVEPFNSACSHVVSIPLVKNEREFNRRS